MDIKISLEIGLSPTLEGFLTRLIGKPQGLGEAVAERMERRANVGVTGEGLQNILANASVPSEVEAAPVAEKAQDPQPEAQRRTRRTKAQMEADAAADTGQSGDQTQLETASQPEAGQSSGQTATNGASPSDLAAALDAEPGAVAKADVAAKMQEAMAATSPKKVQDRMASDLNGAKRLSEIDPGLYGKAIEVFGAIIAGA